MTAPPSHGLAILRHPAGRPHASAAEIGITCRTTAGEVRARPMMLDSMRLVAGRQDPDCKPLRRVYHVSHGGRRRAGISDARSSRP